MRAIGRIISGLALAGLVAAPASASTIAITATSINSGNSLVYTGLATNAAGNGNYVLGNCAYSGTLNQTSCSVTGTYVETGASQFNPGATGTFTFRQVWSGNGPNPVTAISQPAPNANTLGLGPSSQLPTFNYDQLGAFFDLTLSNGLYGMFDLGSQNLPNPQGGTLNWQAFLGPGTACSVSPAPANCSVAAVGQTAGSSIFGPISPFNMQITYRADPAVPEPSTLLLLGTGLAFAVRRFARRRA